MRVSFIVAALCGATIIGNAPAVIEEAHADANSYLAYIQDHHINVGISSPAKQLWMGNTVCQELHQGMSPDQIIATSGNWLFDMPGIIDAARHELCP